MDKRFVILVTGIGGNVGQGIIRNIRQTGIDAFVIGTNVVGFSPGNHLADEVIVTPFAFDDNYIPMMLNIVDEKKVQLILTATDYETYYLAANKERFTCPIAVSGKEISEIYLDKYLTYLHHNKHQLPFADTVLPGEVVPNHWKRVIGKPRKGRGSRGILMDPENPEKLSPEEYMLQEYIEGPEITTAFYVTKEGLLHGHITLYRELENGATISCEVTKEYDIALENIMTRMISKGELRGSVNLQSRVRSNGDIVPFEVNCRISGTNSIRSQFGFCDVQYLIEEYLLKQKPSAPKIIEGKAVRILMDVVYPKCKKDDESINASTPHLIF
tara:strand:- start:155507 stop:156493 length:987 start_codon:yes stop_codon:yes gene_type:complete